MARFLRTADGGLVNADRIVEIKGDQAIRDGYGAVKLGVGDYERLLAPIVAAAPGFVRLCRYTQNDGDEPWIERLPVVAWQVSQFQTYPVVPDHGQAIPMGEWRAIEALLLPDGRVIDPLGETFDSEDAWLRMLAKRQQVEPKAEALADG
jgi:hypothetical protein